MSSADKVLSILSLFTPARPAWSAEDAARELDVSLSTCYRYFNSLVASGLLDRLHRNQYVLGPAIIEFDWQIRIADPMLEIAKPLMLELLRAAQSPGTVLLCRLYRHKVMCIHQESNRAGDGISSYERGRPRPMLRGATSKVILAHLPTRTVANLWRDHAAEAVGLGHSFEEFKAALKQIRRAGCCITRGEVDPGRIGIAAPIFDAGERVAGSVSIVLQAAETSDRLVHRLCTLVMAATRDIAWASRRATRGEPASPADAAVDRALPPQP
jgi:DNA-binding IclR family transcriptional regulator